MSERMSAWILIGGALPRSMTEPLCTAISTCCVSLEWGDATFEPKTPEDLMASRKDDCIWLCDNEAAWGEFPDLEQTCRKLRLAYTRCGDGSSIYDAERVDWRPGMKEPLSRICSNESGSKILIAEESVRSALEAARSRKRPHSETHPAGPLPQRIDGSRL